MGTAFGAVWSYSLSGSSLTHLYTFTGGTSDGATPLSGVTFDGSGNMFGVTSAGGAHSNGTIWEITSGSVYSDFYDFGTGSTGSAPICDIAIDGSGNMYGTASTGGANSDGVVWKYPSGGSYTDIYDFSGTSDGATPKCGVVVDSSGNLYGTTTAGGANSDGVMFDILASTPTITGFSFPTMFGGHHSTATVTICTGAPAGGYRVHVSAPMGAVAFPDAGSVDTYIQTGSTQSFPQIDSTTVTSVTLVNLTATLANAGGGTNTQTMQIYYPFITSISFSPASVVGASGGTVVCTVNLVVATQSTETVTVTMSSSDNTEAPVPATVTVPINSSFVQFNIVVPSGSAAKTITITGTTLPLQFGHATVNNTFTIT